MYKEIATEDKKLIDAAADVIRRNYRARCQTVGSAILCGSNKIYTGVNVDSSGHGSCAETIALGVAISNGERVFKEIVAVDNNGVVMPPCGNCRQLLIDYAPDIDVILLHGGNLAKTTVKEILPDS